MSIEAAIGRIDQILQMQQQLLDPGAAAGSSTSPDGGVGLSTGSGSSGSSTFATALANAEAAGALGTPGATAGATGIATDPLAGVTGGSSDPLAGLTGGSSDPLAGLTGTTTNPLAGLLGSGGSTTYPSGVPQQVQAMIGEANSLVGKPYVYGGGHGGWGPQAGYDCSGFVSAVLHAGGFLTSPVDTTALPSQAGMAAGPGQYVTVYDRALPGQSGHVIIEINGQFYESGGMSGAWGGGGGVEKIGTPSAAYLATFPTVLHPQGL